MMIARIYEISGLQVSFDAISNWFLPVTTLYRSSYITGEET